MQSSRACEHMRACEWSQMTGGRKHEPDIARQGATLALPADRAARSMHPGDPNDPAQDQAAQAEQGGLACDGRSTLITTARASGFESMVCPRIVVLFPGSGRVLWCRHKNIPPAGGWPAGCRAREQRAGGSTADGSGPRPAASGHRHAIGTVRLLQAYAGALDTAEAIKTQTRRVLGIPRIPCDLGLALACV